MEDDLIDLASAHVTQSTSNSKGKGPWMVRQNITSKDLFELPGHLSESDVFKILDFGREFELIAFNIGINFQKDISNVLMRKMQSEFDDKIKLAREENERLAEKLGQLIGEDEE